MTSFNDMVYQMKRSTNRHYVKQDTMFSMEYGPARRKMIVRLLAGGNTIRVNSKYCVQVKKDPDIRKLIRTGVVEVVHGEHIWFCNCRYQELRLKK